MRKIILTVPTLADIKAPFKTAQAKLADLKAPFKTVQTKIEQRRARRAALDALIASAVANTTKDKS